MSYTDLLKNGMKYLLNGDSQYLKDSVIDNMNDWADKIKRNNIKIRKTNDDVPFISEPVFYVHEHINDYSRYHRAVADSELTVSPSEPFDAIECRLVGTREINACTVAVQFVSNDTAIETKQTRFVNGDFNQRNIIPLRFKAPEPVERAEISIIDIESGGSIHESPPSIESTSWQSKKWTAPQVSVPSVRSTANRYFPIFLISIDSLRYDYIDRLESTINVLGDTAQIPTEPRSQGPNTWSSHGAMFTGTYPGDSGCQTRPPHIHQSLTTLPEFLEEKGYTCSGLTSNGNLLPEFGFGRGFHRYQHREISWKTRKFDAQSNVNTIINWIESDMSEGSTAHFYFLQINDTHCPYFPPLPATNYDRLDYQSIQTLINAWNSERNYIELVDNDPLDLDDQDIALAKQYYEDAIRHVDTQLTRLIERIKSLDIFNDSLIIITGDHGEEFYERDFILHEGLNDSNIRPGMAVKQPQHSTQTISDYIDLIDIFPSIATLTSETVPDQCRGHTWTEPCERESRIAERFGLNYYNISVEQDGYKAIFTYEKNNNSRSTNIERTPIKSEYRVLRNHSTDLESEVPRKIQIELLELAEQFMAEEQMSINEKSVDTPSRVEQRLHELGYK